MMKVKVWNMICLAMISLFANQAWAEEWIYYASTSTRDTYYDKSTVAKADNHIVRVWAKAIFKEEGKKEAFSYLKRIDRAPDNPNLLSHVVGLHEIDCSNDKVKDFSTIIYDEKNNVIYSSPKEETGQWKDILPSSVGDILKKLACEEAVALAVPVVTEAAVAVKDPVPVSGKQNETKALPQEAVQNLVTKWLNSWKSGNMESYRSCYASDFKSKGMNLNAWVSHKINVYRKSKKIDIRIDQLQISAEAHHATAIFTQHYRSSLLKESRKKKLELRKINEDWKIYREMMSP